MASTGSGIVTIQINRWAAEFATIYPGLDLDIKSGGSTAVYADFLTGKLDLLPMSRDLTADEIAQFRARFGYDPTRIIVAQDAIAIYVNRSNPVTGLSLQQLDEIFSRYPRRGGKRVEFWREVGVTGPMADQLISRVVLGRVHGGHQVFQDVVLQGADFQFDSTFERLGSAMAQTVGAQDTAIGFGSVMFATQRTRFVPLQAEDGTYVLPTYENTTNGRYPLVRPLWIVFNRKPDGTMNPVAREFLRFAVSRRGQRIIALAETYPTTREQQKAALGVLEEPKPAK